jgi:hypothetical protein
VESVRLAENVVLYCGDSAEVIPEYVGGVESCVTDPPYGLSFMGKRWDYDVPGVELWRVVLEAMLPGAWLLSFAGTRTQHRMAVRIEDAGFEVRDMIAWVYGSGFPKSLDVSKAIDKAAGAERKVVGKTAGMGKQNPEWNGTAQGRSENSFKPEYDITAPATDAARQWQGWGTALKPAMEPITVARKMVEGTVAENVAEFGTGGLNIDGCRVAHGGDSLDGGRVSTKTEGWDRPWKHDEGAIEKCRERGAAAVDRAEQLGRWPANLIHDGSQEVVGLFPREAGASAPVRGTEPSAQHKSCYSERERVPGTFFGDAGSAARFFYCAKASKSDRGEGNSHPTVKPTALMRYLCRLVTPTGGTVLDPFMGSGSTGRAAIREGFGFIGIEKDRDSFEIAKARITHELRQLILEPR